MKIVNAKIRREERYNGLLVQCFVDVEYSDSSTETIFSFYPDEIWFNNQEFIGLTKDEALRLFTKKDMEYLRS